MSTPLIGIDIGARVIRAAQRLAELEWRTATLPRPDHAEPIPSIAEVRAIAAALYRRGFVGKRVALGLPDAAVHEAAVETPPPESGAPITRIAAAELARFFEAEAAALEPSLLPLHDRARAQAGFRAHAAAATTDDIASLIAAFQGPLAPSKRFHIEAISAGPAPTLALALARWPQHTPMVVIHPGHTALRLSVAEPGAVIVTRRLDDLGTHTLTAERPLTPHTLAQRIAEEFDNLLVFLTRLRPDMSAVPTLITAEGDLSSAITRQLAARPELGALLQPITIDPHDDLPTSPSLLRAAALALHPTLCPAEAAA